MRTAIGRPVASDTRGLKFGSLEVSSGVERR
jgi:hypothetical protein